MEAEQETNSNTEPALPEDEEEMNGHRNTESGNESTPILSSSELGNDAGKWKRWGFFVGILLLVVVGVTVSATCDFGKIIESLHVDKRNIWHCTAWFFVGFAFWAAAFVPYTLYILGGAFLFGGRAYPILYLNILIGTALIFKASRWLKHRGFGDCVQETFGTHAAYILSFKRAFSDHGLKLSFLVMFSPVPQTIIVVLLALLTDVDMMRFVVGSNTALFIVYAPQIAIASHASSMSDAINPHDPLQLGLTIGGAVLVLVMLVFLFYLMRRQLNEYRDVELGLQPQEDPDSCQPTEIPTRPRPTPEI